MTAWYTLILVASEMPHQFHAFLLSWLKAVLAFASLVFTLSSMMIDLERVLSRWTFLLPSVVAPWWRCSAQHMVFQVLAGASLLSFWCQNCHRPIRICQQFCMLVLVVAFSAQLSANRNIDNISLHFGLCLKPSEVEDKAISAVLNVDSGIQTTKCIKQDQRKRDTEKSGV